MNFLHKQIEVRLLFFAHLFKSCDMHSQLTTDLLKTQDVVSLLVTHLFIVQVALVSPCELIPQ